VTLYLVLAAILYFFGQSLQMGTGAARLAGVRSKRVATGLTLFNLFATTSRMINLLYAPLMGALIDISRHEGNVAGFERDLRVIIGAATLGTILGGALTPTFAILLQRGIASFERSGTLVGSLARLARPVTFASALAQFRPPRASMLRFSPASLPKAFLFWNVIVMAFWVAGPLSAFDAGVIDARVTGTALLLSGLITGVATITLTLVVDPTAAVITDQAALGMRPESDIKAMLLYLILGAVAGTLLAQVVLWPAAHVIVTVARFLVNHGVQHGQINRCVVPRRRVRREQRMRRADHPMDDQPPHRARRQRAREAEPAGSREGIPPRARTGSEKCARARRPCEGPLPARQGGLRGQSARRGRG
jgi:hypothetical protein